VAERRHAAGDQGLCPDVAIIRRTGIINAYEDPTCRATFENIVDETGRPHVIIAGVTLGTCTQFATLSMLNDGYRVFSVIDAAGAWNRYEADAGPRAYDQRRAEPVTTFA
jgi:nicotinamidase-related amidase